MQSNEHCCRTGCEEAAEYEITDEADPRETAVTYSCEAHVGELLSRDDRVAEDASWSWRVVALA